MQGLRLIRQIGFSAAVIGCLLATALCPPSAQAQATNSQTPSGSTSAFSDTDLGLGDPTVRAAMMTLPDAMAKWKECYAGCLQSKGCSPTTCASDCEGQVVAMGYAASQTSEMLRYNIMGIYGAECIGNFRKYIETIRDAAKRTHDVGLGLSNLLAGVIVDKILDAVIGQILNNLTNQICNVTNQITQAADSFVRNAICLPNVNINPFNFNLNIKNLQCDGFSINPLTGQVNGSPINGINVPITNIYDNGNGGNSGANPMPSPIDPNIDLPTRPIQIDPVILPDVSRVPPQ